MRETVRFTDETDVSVEPADVQELHLRDLESVADVEVEDGEITACTFDLRALLQQLTLHASMERYRYGWRRAEE